MAQQQSAEKTSSAGPMVTDRRNAVTIGFGVALVLLGGLFLIQELTGFDVWHWTWPFIVVGVGGVFFVAMVLGGKNSSGLAIPATIITTTGLILLYQNTFNAWQTWAYAWALIFPTAAGLGTWIKGWWGDQPNTERVGLRMAEFGAILFLAFAAFFELLLNLSGFFVQSEGGVVVAVVLIAVGVYLLLRSGETTSSQV